VRGTLIRRVWEPDPAHYAPARFRKPCAYDAFIPTPLAELSLTLPGDLLGVISDAEKAIADLNRQAGPALAPLARLLLRTESVASSKVEGMQVDARTLARAEANLETGRRIGVEAAEILANVDAMQLAIERAATSTATSVDDLIDVHRTLLAQAPNARIAGQLRRAQNWIGGNDYNPCGADFVPPPPEEVERLLTDLCAFLAEETLPPLVQAAVGHAQFETIHPFDDGNGRTGRALVQIVLRRRGLAPSFVPPVSVILARDKPRYIKGLTQFQADHLVDWLTTFAVAAAQGAGLATRYGERVAELQESWRARLRASSHPRSDAAAWMIIDALPAHPVVTVPVAVAATRRTKPAVTTAVADLERAGVLRRLGESARNRAWEADGLLDLIVGLESGVE
jgi:Fic family protein